MACIKRLKICMCTLLNANHQLVLTVRAYELPFEESRQFGESHSFLWIVGGTHSDFHRGNYLFSIWARSNGQEMLHAIALNDHDNSAVTIRDSSKVP